MDITTSGKQLTFGLCLYVNVDCTDITDDVVMSIL